MRHQTSERAGRRPGAVAVYVAVVMPVLIAVVALAIDAGMLFDKRRHAQANSDAAALAAANELFRTYTNEWVYDDGIDVSGSARDSALSVSNSHGYTNNGSESTVTVNIPPLSGHYVGLKGYAEVITEYKQKRAFSRIFSSDDVLVKTRTVARGRWAPAAIGILCLDPTSAASLKIQGQCYGMVPMASVIVNSTSSSAADGGGQGGTITGKSFEITGGVNQSGGTQFIGPVHTGVPPTPDPFRDLPEPNPNTMPARRQRDAVVVDLGGGLKKYTLQPGRYTGGLAFSGQDTVVLTPGVYYMEGGGFHFSGTESTSLTATGVMLFNGPAANGRYGDIQITGNGAVTWTPPETGVYKGLSFFQARANEQMIVINGNGQMNIKGAWYAQHAEISVGGNGVNYIGNQFVCWNMTLHGSGTYIVPWDPGTIQPVRDLKIVE